MLKHVLTVLIFCQMLLLSSCGVKGDPLPPETPTELGRGRPTYRRAAEKIQLKPQSTVPDEDSYEEDQREEAE